MTSNRQNNTSQLSPEVVVFSSIMSMIGQRKSGIWQGTMTELQSALTRKLGRKSSKNLPGSPSSLRVVIDRVINKLRARSVSVKFSRTNDHNRTRLVLITR